MHHNQLRHTDGTLISRSEASREGALMRPTPSLLPFGHGQPHLPFQAGYSTRKQRNSAKVHFITPVFQVNKPKSHEKTNFGLPLQGADILKNILGKQTPSL